MTISGWRVPGAGALTVASMLLLFGSALARVEAGVETGDAGALPTGPAVSAETLDLVEALAGLAELAAAVRFFHPSDGAREADWDVLLPELVDAATGARDLVEWADILRRQLEPVAPLVEIGEPGDGDRLVPPDRTLSFTGAAEPDGLLRWHHRGLGPLLTAGGNPGYRSEVRREEVPSPLEWEDLSPVRVRLHPGLDALVPTAVPVDSRGQTLPAAGPPHGNGDRSNRGAPGSGGTRPMEIASILATWGALAHFYPHHDLVEGDWDAALRRALAATAHPGGEWTLEEVLERMLATLRDGHAQLFDPGVSPGSEPRPPIHLAWLDDELVVWGIGSNPHGVAPGDRILRVNGTSPGEFLSQVEARISAATDAHRRRLALEAHLSRWLHRDSLALVVEPSGGKPVEIVLPARGPDHRTPPAFSRPRSGAEPAPGVVYLNLGWGATAADFEAVLPKLTEASAIVVDLRGYPGGAEFPLLARLTRDEVQSPLFLTLEGGHPEAMELTEMGGWSVPPGGTFLGDRPVVFLADESAMSRSETVLMMVRHHDLGEIVGTTTAGTNGDMNFLQLPSGHRVSWTGLRVRWPDGAELHGRGVTPDLEVRSTRAGVREGRDEVLEAGIARVLERLGSG